MKKEKIVKTVTCGILAGLIVSNTFLAGSIVVLSNRMQYFEKTNKTVTEQLKNLEQNSKKMEKEINNLKTERWIYKGDYEVTGYCNCEKCNDQYAHGPTKSGKMPKQGRTIAVDTSVIPLGTEVVIDGHVYTAEDIGGAIKGNKIDIYFENHEDAKEFGKKQKEVFI